jgi:hypothetical protein
LTVRGEGSDGCVDNAVERMEWTSTRP